MSDNYQGSRVEEPPTLAGIAGRAWRVRLPARYDKADHTATLALWLVNAPGAHPFWSYWVLSLISLADIPGVKPAHKAIAAATHEIMIIALNPEKPLPPLDATSGWPVYYLTPFDVVQQFEVRDDAQAIEIARLCVLSIVRGAMSPDQDYRDQWEGAITATAQHYKEGKHNAVDKRVAP